MASRKTVPGKSGDVRKREFGAEEKACLRELGHGHGNGNAIRLPPFRHRMVKKRKGMIQPRP